ncbi:MAG: hypothetical protein WB711_23650 [Terriglobales bacterium]
MVWVAERFNAASHQRAQSAAVDELQLIDLHHHVAVLDERVTHVRVQRKNFFPSNDPSLALYDQNIADRTAFRRSCIPPPQF